jgi:hypothetical protein
MMTKEELAQRLDGGSYGNELQGMAKVAKANGLVVVYGASDDLMEFDGALYEEFSGIAYLTADGFLDSPCECDCKWFRAAKEKSVTVKAIWGKGDYSFQYETSIAHATFEIFDGEEKYCKGIVFHMDDLRAAVEKQAISTDGEAASQIAERV